jgi:hypothetical protein
VSFDRLPLDKNTFLVLIVALATCVGTCIYMMPYIPDDSYISFRYAEHLARGQGLTFNPGEKPVEAYSNFLWIMVCAFLHKMGFDLPTFTPYIGAMLAALTVLMLWLILRRRRMPALQMLFPLLLLGSSGPFMTYAISGLEMPLFAFLLMLVMYWMDGAFETGRTRYFVLMAVGGFLLALTRPEGLVSIPVIVVIMFLLSRNEGKDSMFGRSRIKNLVIAAAVFAALVIVYNAWRISYFGELLPTPLLSKGGAGKALWYAWWKNIGIYFYKQGDYYPPVGYYFVALCLLGFVGYSLSNASRGLKRAELAALILAVVYSGVYFNFKDWMPAMRYHSVLAGLFIMAGAHLLTPMFRSADSWTRTVRMRFWFTGFAALFLSYSVLAELKVITERAEVANQECLVKLGKWIREIMPPDATLAISDVGAIPYYSGFRTIDIHPESLTDLYIAKNGFSIEYFYQVKPDIVIIPSRSIFVTRFYPEHYAMADDQRFQKTYRFVGASRFDWFQDRSYWIFVPGPYPKIPKEVMDRFPHGIGTISRKRD